MDLRRNIFRWMWLVGLGAVIISSCSNPTCYDNRSSTPLAAFYDSRDNKVVALDSIEIYGLDAPSGENLVDAGVRTSRVWLPLRPETTSTTFVLHYAYKGLDDEALNDTITFHYTASPYFVSSECGVVYHYNIQSATWTSHLVENVTVIEPVVTDSRRESIGIYFHTEPVEEDGPDA